MRHGSSFSNLERPWLYILCVQVFFRMFFGQVVESNESQTDNTKFLRLGSPGKTVVFKNSSQMQVCTIHPYIIHAICMCGLPINPQSYRHNFFSTLLAHHILCQRAIRERANAPALPFCALDRSIRLVCIERSLCCFI